MFFAGRVVKDMIGVAMLQAADLVSFKRNGVEDFGLFAFVLELFHPWWGEGRSQLSTPKLVELTPRLSNSK